MMSDHEPEAAERALEGDPEEEEIHALEPPNIEVLQETIERWTSRITALADLMEDVIVTDEASSRDTTDIAVQFIDCQEEIKSYTEEALRPYQEVVDQIKGLSKTVLAEASRGEQGAKNALLPYFEGILDTEPASQPKAHTGAAIAYVRSNTNVVITEEKALKPWHRRSVPNLEALKESLENGEDVAGAKLETRHSVVIRRV